MQPIDAPANEWGYRPALDGLRAVAVYLVVAFHAGSFKLQGGFIGVDLFFVLSGFLVTTVILSDYSETGRLNLRRFYARRARRLIPAATAVVVGVAVLTLLVGNVIVRDATVSDSRAASLWYANWRFAGQSSDYFANESTQSPLLHFWSLAIEEQFYLLFPVVLIVTMRIFRRSLRAIAIAFAVLSLLSVVAQLYWANADPNRAYYGTDARAYQLLIGVVLSLVLWRTKAPRFTGLAQLVPLVLLGFFILCATSWLNLAPSTRGFIAALIAGPLVVITAQSDSSSAIVRCLGFGPIRYLGQISYGTYLWHWPIVFVLSQTVTATPVAVAVLSGVGGTALAALSDRMLETPIRASDRLARRDRSVIGASLAVAVVTALVIAPAILRSEVSRQVVPGGAAIASDTSGASVGSAVGQTPLPNLDWVAASKSIPEVPNCRNAHLGDCDVVVGEGPTVLLVGDSFAHMLVPAFEAAAVEGGFTLYAAAASSCPWQSDLYLQVEVQYRTDACIRQRKVVYEHLIPTVDPDVIVATVSDQSLALRGYFSSNEELEGLAGADLLEATTLQTLDRWSAAGRAVIIIEPTPRLTSIRDVPGCLASASYIEQCQDTMRGPAAEEPFLATLEKRYDELVDVASLDQAICPAAPTCDPILEGVVVFRDGGHLTVEMSETLTPKVAELLDEAFRKIGTQP